MLKCEELDPVKWSVLQDEVSISVELPINRDSLQACHAWLSLMKALARTKPHPPKW